MGYGMLRRKLPNGKLASSRERYLRAWQELADPICKATGWKLAAFDPNIRLTGPDSTGIATLPVDFALLLSEALKASQGE
jgi:hypothetical protein